MTAFSTPCTVLTVTSTGAIEVEHLDCLEDARQYISDFPGEEEAQAEPWDDDDAEWTPEYLRRCAPESISRRRCVGLGSS